MTTSLEDLSALISSGAKSRAITAENPRGEVGAGGTSSSMLGAGRKGTPCITLPAGTTTTIADISGAGEIRHLWFTVTNHTEAVGFVLRDLVIRMYWDGSSTPAVEVPLGDFFLCGNGERTLVDSDQIAVAPTSGFNSYLRMPFASGAKITIENEHPIDVEGLFYMVDYLGFEPEAEVSELRLCAQWRRSNPTTPGEDYTILDGVEGAGAYIGTYFGITALERYWWGEGEVKVYLDGDETLPTICGTGTEDYFGGAWAFQDRLSSDAEPQVLPFNYRYCGLINRQTHDTSRQGVYATAMAPFLGMYRWHTPDPILFSRDLRVTIQLIGQVGPGLFERSDDVCSVAYWYQVGNPAPFPPFPHREARRPR